MTDLLDVDVALQRALDLATPMDSERVPLTSLALDPRPRTLAAACASTRALPPFDNSAMDGYAVRAVDVPRVGTELPFFARSKAGDPVDDKAHAPGTATHINTGAPMPKGADAVVMREHCVEPRAPHVVINHVPAVGEHVRRRGEDVAEGAAVGAAGDVVTPARLNLLLSAGLVNVDVFRRPVVGVLASGDELREVGDGVRDDVIVNSNAWAVALAARQAGADVRMLGIARDSLEDHVSKMDVDDIDVLITIGGVSMGSHDFVRPALEQLGATLHLWKIAMRPGKPLAVGTLLRRRRRVLLLGLPGNPVSSMVTFTLFGVPLLKKLQGRNDLAHATTKKKLADDKPFKKKAGLRFYARAVVVGDAVTTLERQGSGQVSGLANANALAVFPTDVELVEPGSTVDVITL